MSLIVKIVLLKAVQYQPTGGIYATEIHPKSNFIFLFLLSSLKRHKSKPNPSNHHSSKDLEISFPSTGNIKSDSNILAATLRVQCAAKVEGRSSCFFEYHMQERHLSTETVERVILSRQNGGQPIPTNCATKQSPFPIRVIK